MSRTSTFFPGDALLGIEGRPWVDMPTVLIRTLWPPNDGLRPGSPRFDAVFDSVRVDGIREPLTINLDWIVIDGHHRLAAARLLGLETVPVRVWTGVEFVPADRQEATDAR